MLTSNRFDLLDDDAEDQSQHSTEKLSLAVPRKARAKMSTKPPAPAHQTLRKQAAIKEEEAEAADESLKHKEMTLDEYEEVLEQGQKALKALNIEKRTVGMEDSDFMQKLSSKKENDGSYIKLGSEKDKRKEPSDNENKSKASDSSGEKKKRIEKGKKNSVTDDDDDNSSDESELYFSILVNGEMLKKPELLLLRSLCRRYMWKVIPARPKWMAIYIDGNRESQSCMFESSELVGGNKLTVSFAGWSEFVNMCGVKDKDVVTFKKCKNGELRFNAHVFRWQKQKHEWEKVVHCTQCKGKVVLCTHCKEIGEGSAEASVL